MFFPGMKDPNELPEVTIEGSPPPNSVGDIQQKLAGMRNAPVQFGAPTPGQVTLPETVIEAAPPGLAAVPKRPMPSPADIQAILGQLQGMRNAPSYAQQVLGGVPAEAQQAQMQMQGMREAKPQALAFADAEREKRILDEVYKSFGLGIK